MLAMTGFRWKFAMEHRRWKHFGKNRRPWETTGVFLAPISTKENSPVGKHRQLSEYAAMEIGCSMEMVETWGILSDRGQCALNSAKGFLFVTIEAKKQPKPRVRQSVASRFFNGKSGRIAYTRSSPEKVRATSAPEFLPRLRGRGTSVCH